MSEVVPMIAIWLTLSTASAECPENALSVAMEAAATLELSYANLDDAAFDAAHLRLKEAIPCVGEEITPSDAFALHRARGLGAFVEGDDAASRRSWLAVRALNPSWTPSASLMPEGHELRKLWETPADPNAATLPMELAPKGGWAVDGVRTNGIPDDRAFVLQGFDEYGTVVHSGYHYQYGEIPQLDIDMVSTERVRVVDGDARRTKIRRWGTVASGAMVVGGGVLIGVGAHGLSPAVLNNDEKVPNAELAKHKARMQALVGAGIGLEALGVTTGTLVWTVNW